MVETTKEETPVPYKVLYHAKGYIRLEIPSLKKLSWTYLYKNVKGSLPFPVPQAIKDFHVNPFKGSIVITYEPKAIDIIDYIKTMASDPHVKKIMKG
jgi:hypothetical protein